MAEPTHFKLLQAHLLIELQRYLPDVTNISVDFDDDDEMVITIDPEAVDPIKLAQINGGESDAEWFVFLTNTGTYLTLPIFIED